VITLLALKYVQDLDKIREHFDSGFERLEKKIDALAARR
jgi:hypothetical protein